MKRKIMSLLTASVLALGGSVAVAVPAAARTADCPVGYSCQWRDANFRSGTVEAGHFSFYQCQHDFSLRTYAGVGGNGSNSATSISNKGRYESAYYYDLSGYVGYAFTLEKGTGDSNLGDDGGNVPTKIYNDRLSAARFSSASFDCQ